MRLFLLPIAKGRSLLYCQRLNQRSAKKTAIEKATTWAGRKWLSWEAAEKGWQKKVTQYGNRAFAKIPYEEWGLKSIPPLSSRRVGEKLEGKEKVDVVYSEKVTKAGAVLEELHALSTERQALHRKWMWGSILAMPLTAPFAALPVIPNLPFFYLVFRAWSNWKALSGSKHVEFLLQSNLIKPTAFPKLDNLYSIAKQNLKIARLTQTITTLKKSQQIDFEIQQYIAEIKPLRQLSKPQPFQPTTTTDDSVSVLNTVLNAEKSRATTALTNAVIPKLTALKTHHAALATSLQRLKFASSANPAELKALDEQLKDLDNAIALGTQLLAPKPDIPVGDGAAPPVDMLLVQGSGRLAAFLLELPEVEAEIERAVEQTRERLERATRG